MQFVVVEGSIILAKELRFLWYGRNGKVYARKSALLRNELKINEHFFGVFLKT